MIKPWRRTTRRRTVATAVDRIQHAPASDLFASVNSYFGLLRQASHSHADRARLANAIRDRGHCVNRDLTKAFRRAT